MPDPLDRLTAAVGGRYRIERQLGSGGMATVYLAEDLKHRRRVALKVLRPELAAVLGAERFLREIEIAAKLNHPHILPLFDSGEADGVLYYVMPFVAGESLRDRLNREKQLGIEDALQVAREVADALDYAHRQGVVHRDIKPENILLEERHAVVADFGIARAISAAGGERLTATGVAVGTPEYMSPEQASGRGELDGRSDVYALGCVLYEMLAGQPPFLGPTVEAVVRQHLTASPPAVSSIRSAVPTAVASALERSLAKTPADRYSTAAQFAQALSLAQPAAAVGWRRLVITTAIVAGLVIVGLGGYWAIHRGGRARSANGPAEPRIVVIPFENLGRPEDEFFADGMTEEITSRLSQVRGIAVIARTSAMQYKGGGKPVRTIGAELQVGYLLEGTVRWSAVSGENRVRITPQLIRVADETHVWTDQYDAVLADVFAVQGQVARQVVSALGVALEPAAEVAQAAAPTRNLEAYEQYLRGNALHHQCVGVPCAAAREASQHFEEAVRLDPDFAAAWAHLALAAIEGGADQARARAREAATRAIALAPDLPDALVALGRLYYATPEQDLAEAPFRRALELQPNHPDALRYMGLLHRRRGNMEAADMLERAADLDPRDERAQFDAGITYLKLRRYDDAERYLERYIAIVPGAAVGYRRLALLDLMRSGDTVAARRAMATPVPVGFHDLWDCYENALGYLDFPRLLCDSGCRRVARELLARTPAPPRDTLEDNEWHPNMDRADLARLGGDDARERSFLDAAARIAESRSRANPTIHLQVDLLVILARLGRKEAAVDRARELVKQNPIAQDATVGPARINTAAEVLALFGEDEEALDQLEVVLSVPSYNSVAMVRVNPVWRRFKTNPRFQALLAKYTR